MKKYILYISATLAILLSCKEKPTQDQVTVQSQSKNQPEKQLPITNLFPVIPLENLPKVDSTNFDNFKQKNKLTDAQIEKLYLKKVNPNAESFYTRYKLSLSKDFETLAVTATSEMEMTTYIINYDKDYTILDYLPIAYDEIAESWLWTTAIINKTAITVDGHNSSGEEDELTKETYHLKNNKFVKN